MYSSEKIISENNVEKTKQKILTVVISKFALNDLDGQRLINLQSHQKR